MMTNLWTSWSDVFNLSLMQLWSGFVLWTPKLIVAIVLFIIGWVLGSLIAKAFVEVIGALKIDKLFASMGADDLLRKAGMNLNTGYFVGQVAKWFVVIVFLVPSLSLVGLDSVSYFLANDVLGFLPKIIIAAFILVIGTVIADFLSKLVRAGTRTMNVHSANMLGTFVKYTVWVFTFIIALGQLNIADPYLPTLFTVLIGAIGLASALAFGLGGRDAAARFIAKLQDESSHH